MVKIVVVLLCCAFCTVLFVAASGKYYFLSTVCLLKNINDIGKRYNWGEANILITKMRVFNV